MADDPRFERIAESNVYETREAESVGWSGYVLTSGTPPASITFEDSLSRYGGSYVFCTQRPPVLDSDPDGFAAALAAYLQPVNNRAAVWLQQASVADGEPLSDLFGPFARFGFAFGPTIDNRFELRSDLNVRIGKNVVFFVLQQTSLRIETDADG
ncbi:MAG: hypothetical protein AAF772_17945, partial [Acidobacteriota bacterium]